METKKHNIFQQFFLSFYSFKDYSHFLRTHGGKLFLYMLMMTVITYVVTFIIPTLEVVPYIYKLDTQIVDEYVPYFEINDGTFYIENEVYYEDENGIMLIYATSDYVIPSDMAREILSAYTEGLIISADEMIIKQGTGQIQVFPFSQMPDMTRSSLYGLIPIIKILIVVMYVVVFIGYVAVYAFGTMVCTLLAMFVNAFVKAPLSFGAMFKLTTYARTAPIIIKMICALLTPFSLHFGLFYLLFAVYALLALKAVKKAGEDTSEPFPAPYDPNAPVEN